MKTKIKGLFKSIGPSKEVAKKLISEESDDKKKKFARMKSK